jgi:hypothetical protein
VQRIPAALAVGVVAALLAGQPAQAYVRTGGTGSKAATVTPGQALTVTGTTAVFPSNAKANDVVAVTATLSNPNNFRRWAHSVTAVFGSSNKGGCTSAAYRVNGSPQAVNKAVPHGTNTLTVNGISVTLLDVGCKSSTVTLTYTVT